MLHRTIYASLSCALLASAALAGTASAQHANLVLFGEPNSAGLEVPAERKAVHPVTSPYYHEDSFVTTDVRAWYLFHDFPKSGTLNGGSANVYALQIRAALTDQLQLVAYKDGITDFDSGLIKDEGWNDLAAGLKWNFLQDWENDLHAAVGAGYQFAFGDADVLQNDQEARFWASVNKGFDRLHLGATVNYLLHTGDQDTLGSSDRIIAHLHADYFVNEWFSPVVEMNGYFAVDDDEEVIPESGVDVANLGGGDDVIALGVGAELRPLADQPLGVRAAYEFPITDDEDLFGYRWTLSAVYSF